MDNQVRSTDENTKKVAAVITVTPITNGWLVKSREGWYSFCGIGEATAHVLKIGQARLDNASKGCVKSSYNGQGGSNATRNTITCE